MASAPLVSRALCTASCPDTACHEHSTLVDVVPGPSCSTCFLWRVGRCSTLKAVNAPVRLDAFSIGWRQKFEMSQRRCQESRGSAKPPELMRATARTCLHLGPCFFFHNVLLALLSLPTSLPGRHSVRISDRWPLASLSLELHGECVLWPHSMQNAGRASEGTRRDIYFGVLFCLGRRLKTRMRGVGGTEIEHNSQGGTAFSCWLGLQFLYFYHNQESATPTRIGRCLYHPVSSAPSWMNWTDVICMLKWWKNSTTWKTEGRVCEEHQNGLSTVTPSRVPGFAVIPLRTAEMSTQTLWEEAFPFSPHGKTPPCYEFLS